MTRTANTTAVVNARELRSPLRKLNKDLHNAQMLNWYLRSIKRTLEGNKSFKEGFESLRLSDSGTSVICCKNGNTCRIFSNGIEEEGFTEDTFEYSMTFVLTKREANKLFYKAMKKNIALCNYEETLIALRAALAVANRRMRNAAA